MSEATRCEVIEDDGELDLADHPGPPPGPVTPQAVAVMRAVEVSRMARRPLVHLRPLDGYAGRYAAQIVCPTCSGHLAAVRHDQDVDGHFTELAGQCGAKARLSIDGLGALRTSDVWPCGAVDRMPERY